MANGTAKDLLNAWRDAQTAYARHKEAAKHCEALGTQVLKPNHLYSEFENAQPVLVLVTDAAGKVSWRYLTPEFLGNILLPPQGGTTP